MDDDDPEMARFLAELENDLPAQNNVILTDDDDISLVRSHSENEAITHEHCQHEKQLLKERLKSEIYDNNDEVDFDKKSNDEDLIDEEIKKYGYEDFSNVDLPDHDEPRIISQHPISIKRGLKGVYDIGELCTLLKSENSTDICILKVPKQLNYVNYLLICTCKSTRHLKSVAEYIKLLYKRKRNKYDPSTVKIEGIDNSNDWLALDLGNIAVHLFLKETRSFYNLESLWSVGSEFDDESIRGKDSMHDPYAMSIDDPNFMQEFMTKENASQVKKI